MHGLRPYSFFTHYMQGAKCKILRICTRARFCIIAHQKCAITKTFCFHRLLHARCQVHDLSHFYTCKILYSFTLRYAMIKILLILHPIHARWKVQDLANLHTCKILHSCTSKICKYQDLCFHQPLTGKVKSVRSCTFVHVQDFALLHIKNVQVPRPYVFIIPYMQAVKRTILHICTHARFCILAH